MKARQGWERALRAGLGPLADAVVYRDGAEAVADRPRGRSDLSIAGGGPASFALSGERTLLSIVDADPSVRGLVSTVLRDLYLAENLEEAAAKHASHPETSFVTPAGIMIGPAVIRTTRGELPGRRGPPRLAVVERDLAKAASSP